MPVAVDLFGNEFEHKFLVLDSHYPKCPIIGRDILVDKMKCKLSWCVNNVELVDEDERQRIRILELKNLYRHVDGSPAFVEPVSIELKENVDKLRLRQKPYKLSNKDDMKLIIEDLTRRNIIKRGISEVCSPMFLVPKATGGNRPVSDYRRLNTLTKHVGYPLGLIQDILQGAVGYEIFTVFDFENGFFNLPVTEETGKLTSVVTPDGQFLLLVLGQGLKQSIGLFQWTVKREFAFFFLL